MKRYLPNGITLSNLFVGCIAIATVLYGQFSLFYGCFLFCLVADYGDGLAARVLNASSDLGKELDSLADLVSFGVVPGAILFVMLTPEFNAAGLSLKAIPAFLVPTFAGLRLARFNLDHRQSETFLGLPTPSVALLVVGILLIREFDSFGMSEVVRHPLFLYLIILLLCTLMIVEVPMFSLKFKHFGWVGNEIKYIFAAITVLLILFAKEAALFAVMFSYVFFSITRYLLKRNA